MHGNGAIDVYRFMQLYNANDFLQYNSYLVHFILDILLITMYTYNKMHI